MPIYVEGAKYVKYIYLLFIVSYIKKFIYSLKEEKKLGGHGCPPLQPSSATYLISTFTVTVSVKRLIFSCLDINHVLYQLFMKEDL